VAERCSPRLNDKAMEKPLTGGVEHYKLSQSVAAADARAAQSHFVAVTTKSINLPNLDNISREK
jgi:hypothetical protein